MEIRSITWRHLRLDAGHGAAVVDVVDAERSRALGRLGIEFPPPWQPAGEECSQDEFEWRWVHPAGARGTARITSARTLSLRVAVATTSPDPVEVSPALIVWDAARPPRSWLGGSCALVVLDERPDDGLVTAAQLTTGFARHHRPARAGTLLVGTAPGPLRLAPGTSRSSTWLIDAQPSLRAAMGLLPSWIPQTVTPAPGQPLRFEFPDAVVLTDAPMRTDERGTEVWAPGGRHRLELRGPGLDCTLCLVWNDGRSRLLGRRATQLLATVDPRTAPAAQAAILDRASADGLVPHDESQDFLDSYCEERIARPPAVLDPLAVPALVRWAAASADALEPLLGQAGRLTAGPEGMLAWLVLSLAARSAGTRLDAPVPLDSDDPLCLALHAVLVGADRPNEAVWECGQLLQGRLPEPGPARLRLRSAVACAILALAPPGWQLDARLGSPVELAVENTRAWLASGPLSDELLAWLVWS